MENNDKHCQFFLELKKRYCRMTVKKGNNYCGEHMETNKRKVNTNGVKWIRIKCPYDNSHTCYESRLEKHAKVCNAKRRLDENPEYIVSGINEGDVDLNPLLCVPLTDIDRNIIDCVIEKVNTAYDKLPTINELIFCHKTVDVQIDNPEYGNNTKKHLIQNSSLLGHLAHAKLIQEDTCFIEFGAGKGKLTYWLANIIDHLKGSTIILVDRMSHRHKKDNKLRNKNFPVNLIRIRADIADLSLSKIGIVRESKHKVGIAKHLCGAATDLTIRCLGQLIQDGFMIDGLVIAFCCHHRCEYISYVGKRYLKECGFLPEEFPILCKIASWATCGSGYKCSENKERQNQELHLRESIGRKVKTLLNWGRIEYLNSIKFDSHLYYYTKQDVSLENMCVVATSKQC